MSIVFAPIGSGEISDSCEDPQFCTQYYRYEASGAHSGSFTGIDNTGAYRPEIGRILVVSTQERFPKNAVVIYGTAPQVSNLALTPASFSPLSVAQSIGFDLSTYQNQTASVTITFTNMASHSILRTINVSQQAAGTVTIDWDGRADSEDLVAPGNYLIGVSVTDGIGNQTDSQIIGEVQF